MDKKETQTTNDRNMPKTAQLTGEVEENIDPQHANESIWFALQKGEDRFKIGLSDILLCVKFAEEIGEIPPLPASWWGTIESLYPHNGEFLSEDS